MKTSFQTRTKSLFVIVLGLMALNLSAISVSFGQGGTQLKIVAPTADILVTTKFNVDITVVDVTDLYAWQIKLYYNPAVLRWLNATYPPGHVFDGKTFFPVNPINDTDADGVYVLFFATLQGDVPTFNGSGTLCRFGFEAKTAGFSPLNFSRPLGWAGDTWLMDLEDIPFTPTEGSVTVVGAGVTEPAVSITYPLNGSEVRSSTVTATWNGMDESSGMDHYEIRLDGGSWANVGTNTTHTLTGLSDGSHTIEVRVTNKAGLSKLSSVGFTVNTSPLFGPGYVEEATIVVIVLIAIVGIALYFLKVRKH